MYNHNLSKILELHRNTNAQFVFVNRNVVVYSLKDICEL